VLCVLCAGVSVARDQSRQSLAVASCHVVVAIVIVLVIVAVIVAVVVVFVVVVVVVVVVVLFACTICS